MQSAFNINGKLTDIFALASEEVRQRAEQFIKSRDDDIRLVIKAHDSGVKFKKPFEQYAMTNLWRFTNPSKE